jgi:hypothetical protein
LHQKQANPVVIQVEYYMLKNLEAFLGGGKNPELLKNLTVEEIEFLPSCSLKVDFQKLSADSYHFSAFPLSDKPCSFSYLGNTYQVYLGFEASQEELKTYDLGIDLETGKATWGAIVGPYRFQKRESFSLGDIIGYD